MTAIVASVAGTSYTFRLLEADIPALTFENLTNTAAPPTPPSADYLTWRALWQALGISWFESQTIGPVYAPSLFRSLIRPEGNNYTYTAPTGKPQLVVIANALAAALGPRQVETRAVLTMALKGGGLDLATAAAMSDNLVRANQPAPGPFSYVQSVLTPQILNAAAAA